MARHTLTGVVIDESYELTVTELSQACTRPEDWVADLVREGVLEPVDAGSPDWRFPGTSLRRAQTAMRLQRDLGVNLAGVALVLDMLDEIDSLRDRLRRFEDL